MRDRKTVELEGGPGDGQLFSLPTWFNYLSTKIGGTACRYIKSDRKPTSCLSDEVFVPDENEEGGPGP